MVQELGLYRDPTNENEATIQNMVQLGADFPSIFTKVDGGEVISIRNLYLQENVKKDSNDPLIFSTEQDGLVEDHLTFNLEHGDKIHTSLSIRHTFSAENPELNIRNKVFIFLEGDPEDKKSENIFVWLIPKDGTEPLRVTLYKEEGDHPYTVYQLKRGEGDFSPMGDEMDANYYSAKDLLEKMLFYRFKKIFLEVIVDDKGYIFGLSMPLE